MTRRQRSTDGPAAGSRRDQGIAAAAMAFLALVQAAGLLAAGVFGAPAHRPPTAESCLACTTASDLADCHRIAVTLANQREWDRAIAIEERVHERQPDNPEVSAALAKMHYTGKKNVARSIALYHMALHAVSGYPPALLGLGTIMQEQGELEIAARYYGRASRESPDVALFKVRLADVLVSSGREGEARPILQEVVKRWPGSSEAESARKLMDRTALARP